MNFAELSGSFFFARWKLSWEGCRGTGEGRDGAHIHRAKVTLLWYKLRYSVIREVREDADEEG